MPAFLPETVETACYRPSEAAVLANISIRTLWRWIDLNIVPGVIRVGRCVRINRKRFDAWLESGVQK